MKRPQSVKPKERVHVDKEVETLKKQLAKKENTKNSTNFPVINTEPKKSLKKDKIAEKGDKHEKNMKTPIDSSKHIHTLNSIKEEGVGAKASNTKSIFQTKYQKIAYLSQRVAQRKI